MRAQYNTVSLFIGDKMAIKTDCQTDGALYYISISDKKVFINVDLPFELNLDEKEAETLDANLHNVVEIVLKPYFDRNKK